MMPPKRDMVFERVPVDDFVTGFIEDVEYDAEHEFTGKFAKKGPATRLILKIEGLKYKKQTRWMSFNYNKKSSLFSKYLVALVENAREYMDFDLDQLKGMKIKMLWKNEGIDGKYQSIDVIRPVNGKIPYVPNVGSAPTPQKPVSDVVPSTKNYNQDPEATTASSAEVVEIQVDDDEVPF